MTLPAPYYQDDYATIYHGDCREILQSLPARSANCCVTSPPYYGLRDYGHNAQIGLEQTPDEYVTALVDVFRAVRRVLRDDGTVWLNLGDSYVANGSGEQGKTGQRSDRRHTQRTLRVGQSQNKGDSHSDFDGPHRRGIGMAPKNLLGIPWRVAFALQSDGWYLRQDIIWHKPNPMPESVTDRCTKAHEYIFLLSKSARYYYDAEAIKEHAVYHDITGMDGSGFKPPQDFDGKHSNGSAILPQRKRVDGIHSGKRNRRSVWTVPTQPFRGAHFAVFPPKLIEPCIKAGCPAEGTVLDPFTGSGTTAEVAIRYGCRFVGAELNASYCEIAANRLKQGVLEFPA